MAKKDLNLSDLKGFVLSPGDIFWIKNSGTETLIAKKADYLNLALVEKLSSAGHTLQIDHQIDSSLVEKFKEAAEAFKDEWLFKEKLPWKKKMLMVLQEEHLSSFELSQFAWMTWSKIEREEVKELIDFDIDLFKRSLNVASGYVYCALLLGYYHHDFLAKLFTNSLRELMTMEKIEWLDKMKAEMEIIRSRDILTPEDKEFVQKIFPKTFSWAGERYNGSGIHSYNKNEMSDLEIVMVALERHYSYRDDEKQNLFSAIKQGRFSCEARILAILRNGLVNEVEHPLSA